ncbi:hypothetical protein FHS57_005141 [Runella defluvii]|uniref:Uncharacterized protein n=1 Tax=Runella defluvii TaxID=370973 RepID=A0A7W5ZQW3_9BACT|nr:hypothetical protein [Runella defluvii]
MTEKIKNIVPWVSLVASVCTIIAFSWTLSNRIKTESKP